MTLILLLLIPFCAGLLCLASRSRESWERLNLLAFVALVPLALKLGADVLTQGAVSALGGFLRADALSALVVGLTALVAPVCAIYSIGHFRTDLRANKITEAQLHHYYVLTPMFVAVMLLVPLADNLGIMWVAIEGSTLASVLLVTFYNQKTSFEAGWKYIIIGSIGISLALFGTLFTYYSAVNVLGSNTQHGMNWSVLAGIADKFDPRAMRLAFILVLLGYGTKAGLAPMHTWKPDAYSEAPVPAAALLGTAFVNCAVYGITRFGVLATKCLGHEFPGRLLAGFGIGSILVAVPFVLTQRNFRRILAYSSIEHSGIMVTALGFGGGLGALGALLHMTFHAVTKPLLFFCAGNLQQRFETPLIRKVRGAIRLVPVTGALFLLAVLAATGVPPFSIFQSEFLILSAGAAAHHVFLIALFILGVIAIFAGFLNHAVQMNLTAPSVEGHLPIAPELPADDEGGNLLTLQRSRESAWKHAAMFLVAIILIVLAFWLPAPFFRLVQQAAQIIGGAP
jgi:hydrogenase-4 component F